MFEASRKMIEEQLNNPNLTWTDEDKIIFRGIAAYTELIQDNMEKSYDEVINPGRQEEEPYGN